MLHQNHHHYIISLIPILKYTLEFDGFNIIKNNNNEQELLSYWIYISVLSYIFLFGCFVPPLITILIYSFIECPTNLISLIIHFWRNIFSCITVIIILYLRTNIDHLHPNFLHICITVCSLLIFLLYFIIISPKKCYKIKKNLNKRNKLEKLNEIFDSTSPVKYGLPKDNNNNNNTNNNKNENNQHESVDTTITNATTGFVQDNSPNHSSPLFDLVEQFEIKQKKKKTTTTRTTN